MREGVLKGARAVLLLSALLNPFAVVVTIALANSAGPFTMFQPGYWVLSFLALPVVWVFVTVLAARRFGPLPKGWLVLHLGIIVLVTFGHFWLMAQFAAGV